MRRVCKEEHEPRTHSDAVHLRRIRERVVTVQGLLPECERGFDGWGKCPIVSVGSELVVDKVHGRDNRSKVRR